MRRFDHGAVKDFTDDIDTMLVFVRRRSVVDETHLLMFSAGRFILCLAYCIPRSNVPRPSAGQLRVPAYRGSSRWNIFSTERRSDFQCIQPKFHHQLYVIRFPSFHINYCHQFAVVSESHIQPLCRSLWPPRQAMDTGVHEMAQRLGATSGKCPDTTVAAGRVGEVEGRSNHLFDPSAFGDRCHSVLQWDDHFRMVSGAHGRNCCHVSDWLLPAGRGCVHPITCHLSALSVQDTDWMGVCIPLPVHRTNPPSTWPLFFVASQALAVREVGLGYDLAASRTLAR